MEFFLFPLRLKLVSFLNENTSEGFNLHRFESSPLERYSITSGFVDIVCWMFIR
jgi:hypothetical protein